ncbi:hypothetical protein ABGB12_00310 [Actinocorallia sp. B10E7]|uniref:hypothetical protein n=1 Tax=Actinocorallia sp. B10E7 TaxID=3153558 RepID=UPI00325C4108
MLIEIKTDGWEQRLGRSLMVVLPPGSAGGIVWLALQEPGPSAVQSWSAVASVTLVCGLSYVLGRIPQVIRTSPSSQVDSETQTAAPVRSRGISALAAELAHAHREIDRLSAVVAQLTDRRQRKVSPTKRKPR